jgi:16S rRNA (uracil1498-N3)-methyltransferase
MTGSIRLLVPADLEAGGAVPASEAQAHYLGRVMRRTAGTELRLFNGRDGEWRARIAVPSRAGMIFEVGERTRPQSPASDIWLVMPGLRRERTEWAVEKATELGAARILFVETQRSNPGRPNLARLAAIAIEAAEQSERLDVPALEPPRELRELLAGWPAGRALTAALERADAPPVRAAAGAAALLVGPEGGFHPGELDVMRRTPFVSPVSLGPRILRAETAAIAGLVLLQARTIG